MPIPKSSENGLIHSFFIYFYMIIYNSQNYNQWYISQKLYIMIKEIKKLKPDKDTPPLQQGKNRKDYAIIIYIEKTWHHRPTGWPRKNCARTKWIKRNCDMKSTLLSQMNSWPLNAAYFSQFGCCNPGILLFLQNKSRYQLCHFSLSVIESFDVDHVLLS